MAVGQCTSDGAPGEVRCSQRCADDSDEVVRAMITVKLRRLGAGTMPVPAGTAEDPLPPKGTRGQCDGALF